MRYLNEFSRCGNSASGGTVGDFLNDYKWLSTGSANRSVSTRNASGFCGGRKLLNTHRCGERSMQSGGAAGERASVTWLQAAIRRSAESLGIC